MGIEKFSKYSGLVRPLLFGLALLLHIAAFYLFNFSAKEAPVETVDFREAEVFKLVDIQEYVPPPPAPVEKKQVVKVANQPKSSEKIVETKEEVQVEKTASSSEQEEYLPQHKISSVPIIPSREVLSRIVYPPMALKQGIEAVVYLELFIDSNGVIRKIKVLKDPGHGFAEAAVAALKGITCVPANANGKNCAVRYRYPVKFTLS
ncbi:MAG: TonB family protein [Treponema sp.]|nr:TonB family protein [Treponema sp.]MBQ1590611.1 TonB family protein [Treponema sp.]MBR4387283.1 TonB family protein [Treponema sp.]